MWKSTHIGEWIIHFCANELKIFLCWGYKYHFGMLILKYRQVSNERHTLVGNKIVDHSDVVGASPVGAALITSSFSTYHLASMDWAKTTARRDEKHLCLGIGASYIRDLMVMIAAVHHSTFIFVFLFGCSFDKKNPSYLNVCDGEFHHHRSRCWTSLVWCQAINSTSDDSLYPSLQRSWKWVYWFHVVRPSVHPWTKSCPLCIFHNTSQIHFIFADLIKQLQKMCSV